MALWNSDNAWKWGERFAIVFSIWSAFKEFGFISLIETHPWGTFLVFSLTVVLISRIRAFLVLKRKWEYCAANMSLGYQGIRFFTTDSTRRASLSLIITNFSPYHELMIEPLSIEIDIGSDTIASCSAPSQVLESLSQRSIQLQTTVASQWLDTVEKAVYDQSSAKIQGNAVLNWGTKRVEQPIFFESVPIRR